MLVLTSLEGIFEGESVENPEARSSATGEATIILIETYKQDLIFLASLHICNCYSFLNF